MVKKKSKKRGQSAAFMRSINPFLKKKKSSSVKRKLNKMRKKRKSKSYKSGNGLKPMQILVGGGIYGAARRYLDAFVKPVTSKIPLGGIADEAGLFALMWVLNKNIKNKMVKQITIGGMAVEAARMGEAFSDGSAFSGISSNGAGLSFNPTLG